MEERTVEWGEGACVMDLPFDSRAAGRREDGRLLVNGQSSRWQLPRMYCATTCYLHQTPNQTTPRHYMPANTKGEHLSATSCLYRPYPRRRNKGRPTWEASLAQTHHNPNFPGPSTNPAKPRLSVLSAPVAVIPSTTHLSLSVPWYFAAHPDIAARTNSNTKKCPSIA